ncbi:SDR family NAD(P)-dependent oxidoreductase [Granulibacter bethesdensis]|nr:SDR family oxidoreductase [Granulibacter bethesdensis]
MTMRIDMTGRKVVVAGASRGIGRSIALACAEAGAAVSICARGAEALEDARAAIAEHGHVTGAFRCDLSQDEEIRTFIEAAADAMGGIDVLVNNATGYGFGDDEANWTASFDVDIMAAVRASRYALPYLEAAGGAAIVNIGSGSGMIPASSVTTPAYGAAKAALIHYSGIQAVTLATKNIRVNCVSPGFIEFPGGQWDRIRQTKPEAYAKTLATLPWGRLGRPEEIADLVVFLASSRASWITGQTIAAIGGWNQ